MKTTKVRIAVAIDSEGRYQAEAAYQISDQDASDYATRWLFEGGKCDNSYHTVIITAEVPLPERIAGEVEGTVEG